MLSLLCSLPLLFSVHAGDGDLDAASSKALVETQQMLRDPKTRDEAAKKDANAATADLDAKRLAGSATAAQAIYDLSADVMATITREAKGDPEKMKQLLMEALLKPEAFAEKFTPEQRARLKAISKTVPDPKTPEIPTKP